MTNLAFAAFLLLTSSKVCELPEKPVLVALSKSEVSIDQPTGTSLVTLKEYLSSKGIDFMEFEDDQFVILISKRIAPIDDFLLSAKWADELRISGKTVLSLDSQQGQQLFNALSKYQSMVNCKIPLHEDFMSLSATYSIKDPTGTIGRQVFGNIKSPKGPLATIVAPPTSDLEAVNAGFEQAKRISAPLPPTVGISDFFVSDFGTLKGTSLQGRALQSLSQYLGELGKELEEAQKLARAAIDSLVAQLADSAFGQEGSKSIKKANFNNLPPGVKDDLSKMAKSNPEMLGFSNAEDATRFLDSNPVLELSYHLVITTKVANGVNANPTISHLVLLGN